MNVHLLSLTVIFLLEFFTGGNGFRYVYILSVVFLIMLKKGSAWLLVGVMMIVVFIVLMFFYFALYQHPYSLLFQGTTALQNPVVGLSDDAAAVAFNESFVLYLLASIEAQHLHNPPLSSDTPKIELHVDNLVFQAIVDDGGIHVERGNIAEKDIVITTTAREGVKMLRDRNYIARSFQSGDSSIQLVSNKATLFAKGYLSLYRDLTGKSMTGSVIGLYTQ